MSGNKLVNCKLLKETPIKMPEALQNGNTYFIIFNSLGFLLANRRLFAKQADAFCNNCWEDIGILYTDMLPLIEKARKENLS